MEHVPSIEMFQGAPAWCLVHSVPSDRCLLQQRRLKSCKMRFVEKKPRLSSTDQNVSLQSSDKTLGKAKIACGLAPFKGFNKKIEKSYASYLMSKVNLSNSQLVSGMADFIAQILKITKRKRILQ